MSSSNRAGGPNYPQAPQELRAPADPKDGEPRSDTEFERILSQPPRAEPHLAIAHDSEARFGSSLLGDVTRTGASATSDRALIRWTDPESREHEAWLAPVRGLALRVGDRVLLTVPANASEPLVLAVVNGSSARPLHPVDERGSLVLRDGESLRVRAPDGTPLVDVLATSEGPVLQLGRADLYLELPGALRIRADEIDIRATERSVQIRANDEVVLAGEKIRLN